MMNEESWTWPTRPTPPPVALPDGLEWRFDPTDGGWDVRDQSGTLYGYVYYSLACRYAAVVIGARANISAGQSTDPLEACATLTAALRLAVALREA